MKCVSANIKLLIENKKIFRNAQFHFSNLLIAPNGAANILRTAKQYVKCEIVKEREKTKAK